MNKVRPIPTINLFLLLNERISNQYLVTKYIKNELKAMSIAIDCAFIGKHLYKFTQVDLIF